MARIGLAIILALCLSLAPHVLEAQQSGKVRRIGSLNISPIPVAGQNPIWDSFLNRMRELGYTEGQNLSIEFRTTGGPADRLPELAAELVRLNVDVILVPATQAALAAKRATTSIPIVMAAAVSPVETGIVTSLARPGETSRASRSVEALSVANGWSCSKRRYPKSPAWQF